MIVRPLGAALAAALLAGCAAAPSPPSPVAADPLRQSDSAASCMDTAGAVAYVAAREPSAEVLAHLTGDAAAEFLRRLNDLPPPTDWTGDEAMVFARPKTVPVLIVLFTDGCATLNTQVPITDVLALLGPEGVAL